MPNDTHNFDKLWIIESLPDGDLKTGTRLYDNQKKLSQSVQDSVSVLLVEPKTKSEFINILQEIRKDTLHNDVYPIIHFECHGCEEGLGVANGELILWNDLRDSLISINHACKLNLMVTLAACNGYHFIKTSDKPDRAPFWGVIGPNEEMFDVDLEIDFNEFYSELIKNLDGDAAMRILNRGIQNSSRKYHFFSVEAHFRRSYKFYYANFCTGDGLDVRKRELLDEVMKLENVKIKGAEWAAQNIAEKLEDGKEAGFLEMRNRFFFINEFPENANRFNISFSDVIEE